MHTIGLCRRHNDRVPHDGDGPRAGGRAGQQSMAHQLRPAGRSVGGRVLGLRHRAPRRGNSGPQGPRYSMDREVDDLHAVADAVGARMLFGHSYGGLIALTAARSTPTSTGLWSTNRRSRSTGRSISPFRSEFRSLLTRGKHVRAMALFLHATRLIPLPWTPYPACWVLAWLLVGRGGEMRDLMSTTPAELDEVALSDGDGSDFATVTAHTFLVSGTVSPGYLTGVLEPLSAIIPRARHLALTGADHNAPDESAPNGSPQNCTNCWWSRGSRANIRWASLPCSAKQLRPCSHQARWTGRGPRSGQEIGEQLDLR